MYKKFLCLITFIIVSSLTVFSQIRIGLEVGGNKILGDINPIGLYNYGLAFNLSGKYILKDKFGIGLSTGLYNYTNKTEDVTKDKFTTNVIPVLLSTEYNLIGGRFRPYFGLDFGFFIHRNKMKIGENKIDHTPAFTVKNSETHFGIVPSFGLRHWFNEKLSANIAIKYICIFFPLRASSNANLSVGINYTLK